MDLAKQLTDDLIKEITAKLDAKLNEVCEVWGIDINNHKEIAERCEIIYIDGDDKREVRVDGRLVMMFTDIQTQPFDFEEPFKMGAQFNCSEILKPEDLI